MPVRPTSLSRCEVLHVAGADLDDVGIPLDESRPGAGPSPRSRPACRTARRRLARIFRPSSPRPWKLYGLVRGLNAPPRRMLAPACLDLLGDLEEHSLALDRARAGDHRQVAAADLDPLDLEDRVLGVELAAGELERLEDRHDLLDPGIALERQ